MCENLQVWLEQKSYGLINQTEQPRPGVEVPSVRGDILPCGTDLLIFTIVQRSTVTKIFLFFPILFEEKGFLGTCLFEFYNLPVSGSSPASVRVLFLVFVPTGPASLLSPEMKFIFQN